MRDPVLRKNSAGYFCIRVPVAGRKENRWVSTGEQDIARAREVLAESGAARLVHLANAGAVREATIALITMGHALKMPEIIRQWSDWLSLKRAPRTVEVYLLYARRLVALYEAKNQTLGWFTEEQLHDFVNDGVSSASTAEMRLKMLKSLYNWASGRGLIVGNLSLLVEVDYRLMTVEQKEPKHHQPISEADYLKALGQFPGFLRDWLILGYCTGARLSDIVGAEWASFAANEIIIYPMKSNGGKRLAIPLDDPLIARPELQELIPRLMAEKRRDPTYIWPDHRAVFMSPKRVEYSQTYRKWFVKLGIQGITFHSTRTAFARRLEAAGRSVQDIARAMAHSSTDTTEIYLGDNHDHTKEK